MARAMAVVFDQLMALRTKSSDAQPIAILCSCSEGTIRVRVENDQEIVMPCTTCGSVDVAAAREKKSV